MVCALRNRTRQLLHRWTLKHDSHRKPHSVAGEQARAELNGEQRIASKIEEVVLAANTRYPQEIFPERGDDSFHLGPSQYERDPRGGPVRLRVRGLCLSRCWVGPS